MQFRDLGNALEDGTTLLLSSAEWAVRLKSPPIIRCWEWYLSKVSKNLAKKFDCVSLTAYTDAIVIRRPFIEPFIIKYQLSGSLNIL